LIHRKCPLTAFILLSIALLIPTISLSQDYDYFIVKRVVDGDTLLLKNGQMVRLTAVDTPEVRVFEKLYRDAERSGKDIETIRQLGKTASDFAKSLVKSGKIVVKYD
jgi:endonuclease YncB( thermonuclease family)